MRTLQNFILLIFGTALVLISIGAAWLGGPSLTSAGAQAVTEISVTADDTDEVESGDRVEATYEMTVSGGDALDLAVSSSICGALGDPSDGDDDVDGELDEDETWIFECRESFSGATDTITVLGSDEDGATVRAFDSRDVTYLDEEADDDAEADDEEASADDADDDATAATSGTSNTRRVLFWAMAGAMLMLVLAMLAYILWRGSQPKKDPERLFL